MSRGGRRRKGKRGRRGAGTGEHRPGPSQEPLEERESQSPGRRRGHGRSTTREKSVLESMSSLPTTLKTLPPDGTDLDELIGALQSEYGVPATPQEYRLIIKVPAAEDHSTDPALEVKPPPPPPADPEAVEAPRPPRPTRRRRRGRRRIGGTTLAEVDESVDVDEPEAPEPDSGGGEAQA